VYRFYGDTSDLIDAMTSGATDVGTSFTAADLPALRQAAPGHFRIVVQPTTWLEHLELNVGSAEFRGKPNPLTDVRVRQALALATDRAGLMRRALHLGPLQIRDLVAFSPWQTSPYVTEPGADNAITGAWDPIARRYVPYGPRALADARRLLARAGYANGLDLEMYHPPNPAFRLGEAQFIVQDWARIGIRVNSEFQSGCEQLACYYSHLETGDFQVLLIANDDAPGPEALKSDLVTTRHVSGWTQQPPPRSNLAGIDDKQINADWMRAESATSTAQRNAWYRRIQERVIRQAYWIPLCWWPDITAVSPRVRDFGRSEEAPVWRPQQWRLTP
jgi:ABC-type transport system substrate-binding protein